MNIIESLAPMRQTRGTRLTAGLRDDVLVRFAEQDQSLKQAVLWAVETFKTRCEYSDEFIHEDEEVQIRQTQQRLVNFYADDAVNPYIALAACGPWIVTLKGAVVYDAGGYGMLGHGHNPNMVLDALAKPQVMANVMTANVAQTHCLNALEREIGHTRGDTPFGHYLFLNSGSEVVTLGARLCDINTKLQTDKGGKHAGKSIRFVALKGAFHGRTQRPALFSDSSRGNYNQHLATFRDNHQLITVEPNNTDALEKVFADAKREGYFIEAVFMEPVMGEGNPGLGITRGFYNMARKLTLEHDSLLLIDSIQAGLRTHGVLSIVDYPGFQDIDAPDMETFSKALSAGQYPMSVLAMTPRAAKLYRKGVYGNTMTTNPRGLDVATCVLNALTPELRANITERGQEMREKLDTLARETDGAIVKVQGTGLLLAAELDPSRFKHYGANSTEEYLRTKGLGVIHGGQNAIRFTPHFHITSAEVDLMIEHMRDALNLGPQRDLDH